MRKSAEIAEDLHFRLRELERELAALGGELEVCVLMKLIHWGDLSDFVQSPTH